MQEWNCEKFGPLKLLIPYLSHLLEYNYILYSILDEQSLPSKIFLDQWPQPNIVVIWDSTSDSGLYIEGEYTSDRAQALNKLLSSVIFPNGIQSEECVDMTCCIYPLSQWKDHMKTEVFKGIPVRQSERKFFVYQTPVVEDQYNNTSRNYEKLQYPFKLITYSHPSQTSQILQAYPTDIDLNTFQGYSKLIGTLKHAKNGFACCLVDLEQKRIISRVFTDWTRKPYCEFGIFTEPRYRKQGFGTITAQTALQFAQQRGYRLIGWHCWASNLGSAKTALKAGFTFDRTHPVWHAWYNAFDNLLVYLNDLVENPDKHLKKEERDTLEKIHTHIIQKSRDYQQSAHAVAEYYQRWISFMEMVIYARSNLITEAIAALKHRLEEPIEQGTLFRKTLHELTATSKVWENEEWQAIINSLNKNLA